MVGTKLLDKDKERKAEVVGLEKKSKYPGGVIYKVKFPCGMIRGLSYGYLVHSAWRVSEE